MRTTYSIRNIITQFIYNIVTFIFIFIVQTLLIKLLGIEYTGLNGLFNNLLSVLNLFEFGIGSSITYNLYKYIKEDNQKVIKSIMNFYKKSYHYIGILVLVIGLVLIPFLNYIVKVTIDINIYIIYIIFLINTISTYFISYKRNLLIANQQNYIINIIDIITIVIINIFQIIILYTTKNYYIYLIIKVACIILGNIVISLITNKMYPYMRDKDIKPLSKKVKYNIVNRVKAIVIHKIAYVVTVGTDNVLISIFLGIKTVGLYTSYNYIISAVKRLFSNVIVSVVPSIGNLLVEKNKEKNYEVFKKLVFINYWIAIFTSVCILILTEPFIKIWLGKDYLLDKFVLFVLVINYFQTMMRSTYNSFKEAAGIWIEDKHIPIIQLSINLITSIILVNIIGLAGVFMGTILSSLILWFYSYPKYIYKNLFNKKIKSYINEIAKYIILSIVIVSVAAILNIYSSNIVISLLICLIIPNLILIIIYKNTTEFNYYKNLIKSIIIGKY